MTNIINESYNLLGSKLFNTKEIKKRNLVNYQMKMGFIFFIYYSVILNEIKDKNNTNCIKFINK